MTEIPELGQMASVVFDQHTHAPTVLGFGKTGEGLRSLDEEFEGDPERGESLVDEIRIASVWSLHVALFALQNPTVENVRMALAMIGTSGDCEEHIDHETLRPAAVEEPPGWNDPIHRVAVRRDARYAAEGPPESIERACGLAVGDRVGFVGEAQARWRVRARGSRFVILTKPFNLGKPGYGRQHYTVIDLALGIRGTDDCVGGLGYESESAIASSLARLESGDFEISVRNNVTLALARVVPATWEPPK